MKNQPVVLSKQLIVYTRKQRTNYKAVYKSKEREIHTERFISIHS